MAFELFCLRLTLFFVWGMRRPFHVCFMLHNLSFFNRYTLVDISILINNHRRGKNPVSCATLSVRGSTMRTWILPESLNLDALLVDDTAAVAAKKKKAAAAAAANARPMGRGGGAGGGRGRGRGRR
jgi:hypothetical protein